MDGHVAEGEAVPRVGGDAAAHRRPLRARRQVVGIGAQLGDDGRLSVDEPPRRHRDHHVVGEHRREARDEIGSGAGGGERAVGGEQIVDGRPWHRGAGGRDGERSQQDAIHTPTMPPMLRRLPARAVIFPPGIRVGYYGCRCSVKNVRIFATLVDGEQLELRDCPTGRDLVRALLQHAAGSAKALVIEATDKDGRVVRIVVPSDESDTAKVSVSQES
jgi:hypothetical protein